MFPMVVVTRLPRTAPIISTLACMEGVVEKQVLTQLIEVLLLTVEGVEALECNLTHNQHVSIDYL